MTRDLLQESTDALRALGEEPADVASTTRHRILRDLQGRRRRRVERRLVFIPAAAVLLIATAAAAASGSLSNAWHWAREAVGVDAPPPRAPLEAPVTRRRAIPAVAPSHPVEETAPDPADETAPDPADQAAPESTPKSVVAAAPEPAAKSVVAAEPKPTAGPAVAAAPESAPDQHPAERATPAASAEPKPDPNEALYREAHRIHFAEHDCGRAVSAWERYLKAAPSGRFALEARYNRGVCLVRLGNTGAAIRALRPFAEGKLGGYRQSEARALIDALGEKTSNSK